MGANITLFAPNTLIPAEIEKTGVSICRDKKLAFKDADVIMGLRIQLERQKGGLFPSLNEYNKLYGLTEDIFDYIKKDTLIMHPGPMNRGVEIDSCAAGSENAVIEEQVTNGVAARMALLYLLTRRKS